MYILLLGPPGVGRGTQATFLVNKYKLNYLTTGHLLRKEAKSSGLLGKKISTTIASGELVSDDIVDQLVKNEISLNHSSILFDGYPRNLNQAKTLESILNSFGVCIDIVINMFLDDDVLVKRISGRFVCSTCSAVYNKYYVKPKITGICDQCGETNFTIRADDSEDIIKKRLQIFHLENDTIVNYYRNQKILVDIDCQGSVNEISNEIFNVIDFLKVKI